MAVNSQQYFNKYFYSFTSESTLGGSTHLCVSPLLPVEVKPLYCKEDEHSDKEQELWSSGSQATQHSVESIDLEVKEDFKTQR